MERTKEGKGKELRKGGNGRRERGNGNRGMYASLVLGGIDALATQTRLSIWEPWRFA